MNRQPIEALIECGITYQTLTVAVSLLLEKYDVKKVHIFTTHKPMEHIGAVMQEFFAELPCKIYGEFCDVLGTEHDQVEFVKSLDTAMAALEFSPVAVVASGTNWMTYQFALKTQRIPTFLVKTQKEFEEKSFFPQNEPLAFGSCGSIKENDGTVPVCYLLPLYAQLSPKQRFDIEGRIVRFLGHELELTLQEAAMYAYMCEKGGWVDIDSDHTAHYNLFCEQNEVYDSNRTIVEEFSSRFKQNVSKINAKIEQCTHIVQSHLTIEKEGARYFINIAVLR